MRGRERRNKPSRVWRKWNRLKYRMNGRRAGEFGPASEWFAFSSLWEFDSQTVFCLLRDFGVEASEVRNWINNTLPPLGLLRFTLLTFSHIFHLYIIIYTPIESSSWFLEKTKNNNNILHLIAITLRANYQISPLLDSKQWVTQIIWWWVIKFFFYTSRSACVHFI